MFFFFFVCTMLCWIKRIRFSLMDFMEHFIVLFGQKKHFDILSHNLDDYHWQFNHSIHSTPVHTLVFFSVTDIFAPVYLSWFLVLLCLASFRLSVNASLAFFLLFLKILIVLHSLAEWSILSFYPWILLILSMASYPLSFFPLIFSIYPSF